MVNILIDQIPSSNTLKEITTEYEKYIKLVADLNRGLLCGGCKMHADCEQLLIEQGSKQSDLWGGGVDLLTKKINYTALINIQPKRGNDSMDILDTQRRARFAEIVKQYFPDYD